MDRDTESLLTRLRPIGRLALRRRQLRRAVEPAEYWTEQLLDSPDGQSELELRLAQSAAVHQVESLLHLIKAEELEEEARVERGAAEALQHALKSAPESAPEAGAPGHDTAGHAEAAAHLQRAEELECKLAAALQSRLRALGAMTDAARVLSSFQTEGLSGAHACLSHCAVESDWPDRALAAEQYLGTELGTRHELRLWYAGKRVHMEMMMSDPRDGLAVPLGKLFCARIHTVGERIRKEEANQRAAALERQVETEAAKAVAAAAEKKAKQERDKEAAQAKAAEAAAAAKAAAAAAAAAQARTPEAVEERKLRAAILAAEMAPFERECRKRVAARAAMWAALKAREEELKAEAIERERADEEADLRKVAGAADADAGWAGPAAAAAALRCPLEEERQQEEHVAGLVQEEADMEKATHNSLLTAAEEEERREAAAAGSIHAPPPSPPPPSPTSQQGVPPSAFGAATQPASGAASGAETPLATPSPTPPPPSPAPAGGAHGAGPSNPQGEHYDYGAF